MEVQAQSFYVGILDPTSSGGLFPFNHVEGNISLIYRYDRDENDSVIRQLGSPAEVVASLRVKSCMTWTWIGFGRTLSKISVYRKRTDESVSSFIYFAFTVSCQQLMSLQANLKKKHLSTITWVKLNSKFEKEVSCRLSDILSGKATVLSSQCNNFQSIIESAGTQRDGNRLNSAFGFVSGFQDLKPVVSFWQLQCIKRKLNSSRAEASWHRISCTALKSSVWFCFVDYILYNSFLTQLVRIDNFYFHMLYLLYYVGMWWLNSFPTKQLCENSVWLLAW